MRVANEPLARQIPFKRHAELKRSLIVSTPRASCYEARAFSHLDYAVAVAFSTFSDLVFGLSEPELLDSELFEVSALGR